MQRAGHSRFATVKEGRGGQKKFLKCIYLGERGTKGETCPFLYHAG